MRAGGPSGAAERRRGHGDKGSATVEFVGALLVLGALAVTAIQFGVYAYARHVVASAAAEGARRAAEVGRSPDEGRAVTVAELRASLGTWAARLQVAAGQDGDRVVVEVWGDAPGIGPLPDLPVRVRAGALDEDAVVP